MSVNIRSIVLSFPVPWSTRVLLSVPLAAPDRHLPSTVRPQCGDAVKPARKCEGGTEEGSSGLWSDRRPCSDHLDDSREIEIPPVRGDEIRVERGGVSREL